MVPVREETEGTVLDTQDFSRKRGGSAMAALTFSDFWSILRTRAAPRSYKCPGAFYMLTLTKVQCLTQRGCKSGRLGGRGKITAFKKKLICRAPWVVWCEYQVKPKHSAFHSVHMSPDHLSSLGDAVQISQWTFEALWTWEEGCLCQMAS